MSIWSELRRRKVVKVAAVYAVTAWLLIQVVVTIEEPLNLPGWVDTLVIVLLAVGLPISLVLSWAFDVTPDGIRATAGTPGTLSAGGSAFGNVSQGLVLLAVGFLVVNEFFLDSTPTGSAVSPTTGVLRYRYAFPEGERLQPDWGISIAVSGDGSRILYVGEAEDDDRQLWLRERDKLNATPVPNSHNAINPFFAPSGTGFGFVTLDREIKLIAEYGGEPMVVANEALRASADWGDDDNIYYMDRAGIRRVAAAGAGKPQRVAIIEPDDPLIPVFGAWPDVLPGSNGVLFTIVKDHLPNVIAVADTRTGEVRRLMDGEVARYSNSGHLLHVRSDGSLMATPFDIESLSMSGETAMLGGYLPEGEAQDIVVSNNGRLIYIVQNELTFEAVWVDRQGNWTPVDPDRPLQLLRYVNLSPDNRWLAVSDNRSPTSSNDNGNILVKQLPRGPLVPLTFTDGVNMRPAWTPDNEAVAFVSDRSGNREIWIKSIQGTGEAEVMLRDSMPLDEVVLSRDGEWIIYRRGKETGQRDILAVRRGAESEPISLAASAFDESSPALSPDGRWLAYAANRGEQWNVFVTPFPEGGREIHVSVDGGIQPVWSPDRAELYYVNGENYLVAVDILPGKEFTTGPERILFSAEAYSLDQWHSAFDVAMGSERFVMIRISESGTLDEELIVVENFFQEIDNVLNDR